MAANGNGARNLRIAAAATNGTASNGGPKVDPKDPQVRKLVYNMYRGMLDQKHQKANVIVESVPQDMVTTDEGIGSRLESMMRQQNELKGGNMNAGGPAPPPPPPPPIPGVVPATRLPSEIPPGTRLPVNMNPPAALAGAMMKDKKPFTYTPGGLDLSEINSQGRAQNGDPTVDLGPPVQSRSFRLLQNVLDHQDPADGPSSGQPMKVEMPAGMNGQKAISANPKAISANNPSVGGGGGGGGSGGGGGQRTFVSVQNVVPSGQQSRGSSGGGLQQNGGYKIIPVQQSSDDVNSVQIGGYKTNASNPNQLSNIFKNQVRVSSDSDEARSRGGYFPAKNVVVSQKIEPQGPVHIPNLRPQQPQQQHPQGKPTPAPPSHFHQQPNYQQPQGHYYQQPSQFQPQFQHPGGPGSTSGPSEQEVPEPKKYMGGSIPSRSFRMLQAMTTPEEALGPGMSDM